MTDVCRLFLAVIILSTCASTAVGQHTNIYPWVGTSDRSGDVTRRIAPPAGFERVEAAKGSFSDWLRHLPLKRDGVPVRLHNGAPKFDQSVHVAVVDIDTGSRDLQQCADAVIRLRAEYLYSKGLFSAIHFNFTCGATAAYEHWRGGFRPDIKGSNVRWIRRAPQDSSYGAFRSYLDIVFTYAGTLSLSRELDPKHDIGKVEIGDVFIRGGSPGHAVLVIDMAENRATGDKVFLLAQSYMPAQDIHILKNPTNMALSPWYPVRFGDTLRTPEWDFKRTELRKFRAESRISGAGGPTTSGR